MNTKHYFQKLPTESYSKQTQSLPVYATQPEEGDEGGLELGQLLAALRRRILVIAAITTASASTALAVALTSTPSYEAKFELLTNPITAESQLASSPLKQETEERPSGVVDQTKLKVLQSPKLMSPIVKQIEAQYPGSGTPQININLIEKTNILEVTYQDPNPEKVQLVLDLISKAYLKYSLEERQVDVRQGIQFVEFQLPKLQQRVETLQEQLQKFRQRYGTIDPVGQGQQLSSQLSGIVQQRLDTQNQLAKTRALYTALQSQLKLQPEQAASASSLSQAPRYQSLLNKLQELESKIAVESARYRDDSPAIQSLRTQQQNLLPLVEQERLRVLGNQPANTVAKSQLASPNSIHLQQTQQFLDAANQIQALEAQNKVLTQAESLLREQVKQFPILTRQNDDLERQLKIAVDNLNQFLTKREALRIDAAQKQVPWQMLTPPTKPEASLASAKRNFFLGAVLGLLLGIGAALIIDKFSNVFYTLEQVKDTTKLPVLGEIPLKQEPKKAVVAGGTNLIRRVGYSFRPHNISHFWESLSSLYSNIRFLGFDTPIRSLAIISASPEDGRSTIALHLAGTAAAMGQRVLLVDADLRSPQLHMMLGLPNINGLSNIIAEDLDFEDCIQLCDVPMQVQDDGLWEAAAKQIFVLTAGQVPPNPTSLLSSNKMQNLVEKFQAAFDLIIYDTSPILGLADSSLLAVNTDASILLIGIGKTNRSALVKVLDELKISGNPVLGVVANRVRV